MSKTFYVGLRNGQRAKSAISTIRRDPDRIVKSSKFLRQPSSVPSPSLSIHAHHSKIFRYIDTIWYQSSVNDILLLEISQRVREGLYYPSNSALLQRRGRRQAQAREVIGQGAVRPTMFQDHIPCHDRSGNPRLCLRLLVAVRVGIPREKCGEQGQDGWVT